MAKLSEKRFVKDHSYLVNYDKYCILDKLQHKHLYLDEVVGLLNEQQSTIQRFEEYVFSDETILCYNCLFCQEKDIYEVKCERKGSVDVHGTCQYYEKKR